MNTIHKKSCDLVSSCSTSSDQHEEDPQTPATNPLKHRTQLCKNFSEKAHCPYGNRCRFAHGAQELVSLPMGKPFRRQRCNSFWRMGSCPYGTRCHFLHPVIQWDSRAIMMALRSIHNQQSKIEVSRLMSMLRHP